MMTNVEVRYGIAHRETGAMLRVQGGMRLTLDDAYPVFIVNTPEALAEALIEDTPMYNADITRPNWGDLVRDDLVPVEVRTVIREIGIETPLLVNPLESRYVPPRVAARYVALQPDDLEKESLRLLVVPVADDANREELDMLAGKQVMVGDRWDRVRVLGVGDAPEEYQELAPGQNLAILVGASARFFP